PCANYGRLLMCPPHSMDADETRKLLKNYRYALLLRNEAEAEEIVGFEVYEKKPYRAKYSVPLHEVINQLEAEAFYMGYYYALGLKSGPCLLCAKEVYENKGEWPKSLPCIAIKSGVCKHPLKARPCLEAVGIDVYATANNAGWPIYVVGIRSDPKQIPCVGFHGLLLTC
nr:hypothetical protein [Nitrososphaeria archaeon]NIN52418.1 hypothetical protein [Nitrososphaeria archaeon]NIQ34261.1 hypothetical protein [Nitrososphaeria archaeon]